MRPGNALIIMARSPEAGEVKTRLSPALDKKERRALYSRLLDDTVNRLRAVDSAEIIMAHTPDGAGAYFRERFGLACIEQGGGDLGQRLSRVITLVLGKGYGRVAVVGSDIPGLDAAIAEDAFNALEAADVAIGPSRDGGYYLIAMSRPMPELFRDIPWSSPETLRKTIERAEGLGLSVRTLCVLDDVDTPEDLERLGLI